MKCALYLRVSTGEQTTDNQFPDLVSYAENHGWEITDIYRENESAWKAGHQAELARLLNNIKRGLRKYDILLVMALDRLSRQGPLTILQLIHTFKDYGVKVISTREPFTGMAYGFDDVCYSFFGWIAQFESTRRSENTKKGLARVKAKGIKLGRPAGRKDSKPRRKKRPVLFKYSNAGLKGTE